MIIQQKTPIEDIFSFLKEKILDWVPREILEIAKSSKFKKNDKEQLNCYTFSTSRFIALIRMLQRKDIHLRADNATAFLRYLYETNAREIKKSSICVVTSDFFDELIVDDPITYESLFQKLDSSYHKIISVYLEGGKPNVSKGIYKNYWIRSDQLEFFISDAPIHHLW